MNDPNSSPSQNNPAVQACVNAYLAARSAALDNGATDYDAETAGDGAYMDALPHLSGRQNICDYIACIGQAMIMTVIYASTAKSYLYAAQVALTAIRNEDKKTPAQAA